MKKHSRSDQEYSDWVAEGTPLDAMREMFRRAAVQTEEFHRVYSRLLDGPMQHDRRIRYLFEDLLNIGLDKGPGSDWDLLMRGLISTQQVGAEGMTLEERLSETAPGYV